MQRLQSSLFLDSNLHYPSIWNSNAHDLNVLKWNLKDCITDEQRIETTSNKGPKPTFFVPRKALSNFGENFVNDFVILLKEI